MKQKRPRILRGLFCYCRSTAPAEHLNIAEVSGGRDGREARGAIRDATPDAPGWDAGCCAAHRDIRDADFACAADRRD